MNRLAGIVKDLYLCPDEKVIFLYVKVKKDWNFPLIILLVSFPFQYGNDKFYIFSFHFSLPSDPKFCGFFTKFCPWRQADHWRYFFLGNGDLTDRCARCSIWLMTLRYDKCNSYISFISFWSQIPLAPRHHI